MRTSIQIGVIVAASLLLDIGLYISQLAYRLPARIAADIGAWGGGLSIFAVPALFVLYPATHSARRRFGLRVVTAVFTSWYLQLVFRFGLNLPALREIARIEDPTYDGIGTNAAILMMGWLPPLIVSLLSLLLLFLLHSFIWWRGRSAKLLVHDETSVQVMRCPSRFD
jgi:hypothetical protein